jgi:hypothetical protein
MIPAFILMYYLSIVPAWLRYFAFLAPVLFAINYGYVMNGHSYYSWPGYAGYICWMLTELLWAYFLWLDLDDSVYHCPETEVRVFYGIQVGNCSEK